MMFKIKTILPLIAICVGKVTAQDTNGIVDGAYKKLDVYNRPIIPYAHLREADVMWSRRVWRVIDLRQKINLPLYYPIVPIKNRKSIMQVLYEAVVKEGSLTAYDGYDDEFGKALTKTEILTMLNKADTFEIENPETGKIETKIINSEFDPSKVFKLRVKEEWFFDKQRSTFDCRIIGICPVITVYADDGSIKGERPLFWIYYNDARYIFAHVPVFNRNNDAERRTLDDIFWKRMFGSVIYKVSNVYAVDGDSRSIADYTLGKDALLEAEKLKLQFMEFEADLWEH